MPSNSKVTYYGQCQKHLNIIGTALNAAQPGSLKPGPAGTDKNLTAEFIAEVEGVWR